MFFLKTVFGSAKYPRGRMFSLCTIPCLEVILELLAVVVLLLSEVLLVWLVLLLLCLQHDLGQVVGQLGHPGHACAAAEKCCSFAQACASWRAAATGTMRSMKRSIECLQEDVAERNAEGHQTFRPRTNDVSATHYHTHQDAPAPSIRADSLSGLISRQLDVVQDAYNVSLQDTEVNRRNLRLGGLLFITTLFFYMVMIFFTYIQALR